ncbi:TPA: hypothetical protein L9V35_003461 [Klebsiella pneumoniae]|uniref:hypothetical protein n=1 Tax=Klebsiella TaxID=570 RepID=UPI000668032B|nr:MULTISPECIES: hypothetical protein [Klebsiella]HCB0910146.1 hypothetical protein [Klebsiella variicola subsp. variicola]ELA0858482.1 hypothetical protein [Klebsiella pneumoniae]ELN4042857.1 hypothetical protein [Klebsiella variicola]MBD7374785.1 hypothetical protein [Klebsiella pneumoniae]MBD7569876.1 hypothetical protein [Klebsiella pneumoniae]
MLNRDDIEVTVISLATKQGLSLNGKDLLDIRTQVATALAAKKRHRQRMMAPAHQWKKPDNPRH